MADEKVYYSRNGILVTQEQASIIDAARHDSNGIEDDESELDELDSDVDNDSDDSNDEDEGQ